MWNAVEGEQNFSLMELKEKRAEFCRTASIGRAMGHKWENNSAVVCKHTVLFLIFARFV
jgi:hypothetical protein